MKVHFISSICLLFLMIASFQATNTTSSGHCINPNNYVEIKNGAPYTVPTGQVFVISAIGFTTGTLGTATVEINGAQEGETLISLNIPSQPSVAPWTPGLVAHPGDVVSTSQINGVVYGYLSAEQ